MAELVILYFGSILLMMLSQMHYPSEAALEGRHRGFLLAKSDIFMSLTIAWLTCFSFLRTSYNDTGNYIRTFSGAASLADGFASGLFTDVFADPLSMVYRSLVRTLTDNFHIYFFFPAFLSNFTIVKLFKRYSVDMAMSMLIFFSIGTYIMYIVALKQCLAVVFLVISVPYVLERKYVRFYLWVLIAVLFHTYAFMFALAPLMTEKPWGKVTWILLAAAIFSMLTYRSTLGAFMSYAQSLGALMSEEEVFDENQINILRVLVYWIPAILALVFRRRLFYDSTREENLFVNLSIFSAFVLTIGLAEGANLYARMAGYFELYTCIALPWMIRKIFNEPSARIVTNTASVLYFGYFMYEFAIAKDFGRNYYSASLWDFLKSLI